MAGDGTWTPDLHSRTLCDDDLLTLRTFEPLPRAGDPPLINIPFCSDCES